MTPSAQTSARVPVRLSAELFGRHVREGAEHVPFAGQRGLAAAAGRLTLIAGEAEIQQDRIPFARDHDVAGLDVTMDDAGLVRRVQRSRGLLEEAQDAMDVGAQLRTDRHGTAHPRRALLRRELGRDGGPQIDALDVAHGDVGRIPVHVGLVHPCDSGVLEPRDRLGLPAEARALVLGDEACPEQLDRDVPSESVVSTEPDLPLTTGAELAQGAGSDRCAEGRPPRPPRRVAPGSPPPGWPP